MTKWAAALMLAALAAGCTTLPPEPGDGSAGEPPGTTTEERGTDGAGRVPDAVMELAARAESASTAGDHEQAAAHLERALRMAPEEPALWQNLAVVRYRQGDYREAESMALKSSSLPGASRELRRQNWALIAVARRLAGDREGADEAQQRAAELARDGSR